MKKRALSMLLALAMCFSVFAVVGTAKIGTYEKQASDGVAALLSDANDAALGIADGRRIDVIKAYAEKDKEDAVWTALAEALVTKEAVDDSEAENPSLYPYFLLRYLEANEVDLSACPTLAEAVQNMKDLDADVNTSNKSMKESLDMFGDYSDRLQAVSGVVLSEAGKAEAATLGISVENVVAYAKTAIKEAIVEVAQMAFIESAANFNDEFYGEENGILAKDVVKKNAALYAGEEVLNRVNGALKNDLIAFAKSYATDPDGAVKALREIFVADAAKTAEAIHAVVDDVIEADIPALDAIDKALEDSNRPSLSDIHAGVKAAANAVDAKGELRAVWFDLVMGRLMNIYSVDGKTALPAQVEPGTPVAFGLYHPTVWSKIGLDAVIPVPADQIAVVSGTEGVEVVFEDNAWRIKYEAEGNTIETAVLHVYRGKDAVDGNDATRYIESYTVKLVKEGGSTEEPAITITSPVAGTEVVRGGKIVIKGETNLENVTIQVIGPDGKVVDTITITAEEYRNGYTYTVPEDAAYGDYTIVAGDPEKGVEAKTTFKVTHDDSKPWVDLDETVLKQEYHRGDSIVIKGTSNLLNSIVVTIIKPDGTALVFTAITPEKFAAEGLTYTIPDDAEYTEGGKYQIIVGETSAPDAKYTDSWKFDVVPEGAVEPDRYVDIDESALVRAKRVLSQGSNLVIKGKSKGFESVVVAVVKANGDKLYYSVLTPEEFEKGVTLKLDKSVFTTTKTGDKNTADDYLIYAGESVEGVAGVLKTDYDVENFDVKSSGGNGGPGGTVRPPVEPDEPATVDIFNKEDHMAYIIGYEDDTVRPESNITREEVTTIFYRLLTEKSHAKYDTASTDRFPDMEADRWSMTYVATIDKVGIIRGYEDGTFRPGRAITRAEFAALISRLVAVEAPAADAANTVKYADAVGHWAESSINLVTNAGWFIGDDQGNFRPEDQITRAEAVTVINRMLERNLRTANFTNGVPVAEFSDLSSSAWYYNEMVEAINGHTYTKNKTSKEETWTGAAK